MFFFKAIIVGLCFISICDYAAAAGKEYEKLYKQGVQANKSGKLDEAIRFYSKAISIKADAPGLYFVRGRAYEQKKELDQAISDFNRAIAIKPGYADAYNHRGVTYIGKGAEKNAAADFKKACELGSKDGCANALKLEKSGK